MRRARQRFVALAVAVITWLVAGSALAFHAGNLFDVPPGGGGGGGLFYTGSPREHGWTCGACHIDAPGRVEVFEARGKDHYLKVGVPAGGARYLVYKGSVAIDGISLTVAEVAGDSFAVWLIPHTLAVTNLRGKKAGDTVNLEFDLLAKYVEKLNANRPA